MTPEEIASTAEPTRSGDDVDSTETSPENSTEQRVELSLVLEFKTEHFLGANGELNEDLMVDEALTYAEKAAYDGAFDVEITPIPDPNQ
jgi:hypothetical protein